jgi:hypothetical protein
LLSSTCTAKNKMNQELENHIFNLKMNELLSSFEQNSLPKKRAYFLANESYGIGAKVYNDQNYFYDLTTVHAEEPLGFNHPLLLRTKQIPNQCHLSLILQNSIESIQNLFETHFGISMNFVLLNQSKIKSTQDKSFYLDTSFFRSTSELEKLSNISSSLEHLILKVSSDIVLCGTSNLKTEQGQLESISSQSVFEVELLERKLSFYLDTNALDENGKINSINKSLSDFSKGVKQLSFKELSLSSTSQNYVDASKLNEALKENGILVSQEGNSITMNFPFTILEEELTEIFKILKEIYVSN